MAQTVKPTEHFRIAEMEGMPGFYEVENIKDMNIEEATFVDIWDMVVEKWELVRESIVEDDIAPLPGGQWTCAFCMAHKEMEYGHPCDDCPVQKVTDGHECENTNYQAYIDAAWAYDGADAAKKYILHVIDTFYAILEQIMDIYKTEVADE